MNKMQQDTQYHIRSHLGPQVLGFRSFASGNLAVCYGKLPMYKKMIYYDLPITQGAFSTSKTLELPEGAVMALSQLQSVQVTPFYGMIIPFITTKTSGISGFNHQKKPMITPSKTPMKDHL